MASTYFISLSLRVDLASYCWLRWIIGTVSLSVCVHVQMVRPSLDAKCLAFDRIEEEIQ